MHQRIFTTVRQLRQDLALDDVTFLEECSDADLAYVGRLSGLIDLQLAGQIGLDGGMIQVNVTVGSILRE
jgi:hypothetical protein